MSVQRNGGGGLEQFAVEGGQDADDVVGACARLNNAGAAVRVSDMELGEVDEVWVGVLSYF